MFDLDDEKQKSEILELLDELMEYYEDDNWLIVKKYILRYSHPDTRKNFSTRHIKTKKHTLNSFEKSIISFCKEKYSKELVLYPKDDHEIYVKSKNKWNLKLKTKIFL